MPQRYAEDEVRTRLVAIGDAVAPWCQQHHHYPLTEQELADALRADPSLRDESKYARRGATLRYQAALVPNAKPGIALPTQAPGQLFYLVSSDGSQFWVLGSILPEAVSNTVTMTGSDFVAYPPCISGIEEPAGRATKK